MSAGSPCKASFFGLNPDPFDKIQHPIQLNQRYSICNPRLDFTCLRFLEALTDGVACLVNLLLYNGTPVEPHFCQ